MHQKIARILAFVAAAICASYGSLARADALADVLAAYAPLPGKKALAVAQTDTSVVSGSADSQANESAAALSALQRCEEARVQARFEAKCEIVRSGGTEVATAAAIKTVVRKPHPLFLWRFQSGRTTVYLAGSVHVMKPTLYPLPAQFESAFAAADRIAVELDIVNAPPEATRETTLRYALLPPGTTIGRVVSKDAFDKLSGFLASEQIPMAGVERYRPAILANQLAVMRLVALGYLPVHGMETHFLTRAETRPILELETMDDQLAALTSPDAEVQEEMLVDTLEQMPTIEPIVAGLLTAWFGGDDAEFMRLFELQSGASEGYRKFMHRILDERNLTMAERVSGYLATGGTTFVLVGSAHLAGKVGIPEILASRGYTGHRIHSDETIEAQ